MARTPSEDELVFQVFQAWVTSKNFEPKHVIKKLRITNAVYSNWKSRGKIPQARHSLIARVVGCTVDAVKRGNPLPDDATVVPVAAPNPGPLTDLQERFDNLDQRDQESIAELLEKMIDNLDARRAEPKTRSVKHPVK